MADDRIRWRLLAVLMPRAHGRLSRSLLAPVHTTTFYNGGQGTESEVGFDITQSKTRLECSGIPLLVQAVVEYSSVQPVTIEGMFMDGTRLGVEGPPSVVASGSWVNSYVSEPSAGSHLFTIRMRTHEGKTIGFLQKFTYSFHEAFSGTANNGTS